VTLNYRLNAFGFLAGDLLQQESPDGSVGNYGLQDQRAALAFVKANIAAFGGNPDKITIFGESAGGASVANHLASPRSLGLFSGAIIESGSFSDWTAQPPNISFTRLPQVAKNLGCQGAGDVLACMRAANATTLMNAQHDITSGQLTWSPTEDGVEVLADPRTLLAAGKVASVPVMLGINHDEGTLFNSAPDGLNASDYVAALAAELGESLAEIVAAEYPPTYAESPWWSISTVLRDSQMLCPARTTATLLNSPLRVNGTKPVYAYFYTQILELIDIVDIFRPLRCFHGSELVSVFDLQILLWGAGEQAMADTFVGYWTTFMNTGSPNGPNLPTWDPFTGNGTGQDLFADISTTPAGVNVTMITGLQAQECAFWAANPIPEYVIWG
jgi:para-nitrobenzyl esterase